MTSLTKDQKGEGTKWTLEKKEEKEEETVGTGGMRERRMNRKINPMALA